jgi:hypothetical protein
MNRYQPLLAIAFALLPAAAGAGSFTLEITGDPGAGFEGTCEISLDGALTTLALKGEVPWSEAIEADGLVCEIDARGLITVEATRPGGSRNRIMTSGKARISLN